MYEVKIISRCNDTFLATCARLRRHLLTKAGLKVTRNVWYIDQLMLIYVFSNFFRSVVISATIAITHYTHTNMYIGY